MYAEEQSLNGTCNNCLDYEILLQLNIKLQNEEKESVLMLLLSEEKKIYVVCKDMYIVSYNLILLKLQSEMLEE